MSLEDINSTGDGVATDQDSAEPADRSTIAVQFENVKKSYTHSGTLVDILRGVNTTIKSGETVAILGPSGSGKSTLLALLAGLDSPTSGHVYLDGVQIDSLGEKERTAFRGSHLGIVFQQFHLMTHMSALENVALPLRLLGREEVGLKAARALEAVGLGKRGSHLPKELSGGECQRVAIARAMVTRPAVLLADEPSGNLDLRTGASVMDLLFKQTAEIRSTLILVTHDPNLAQRCQRQLLLKDGLLVES